MTEFGSGHAVRRVEDEPLLRGQGRFIDDITFENEVRAVFLRSPHAHARINSIDIKAAAAMPGVIAVYTGADVKKAGLLGLPSLADKMFEFKRKDGTRRYKPEHPVLALDTVRHVGDAIAMVVAESVAEAKLAVEAIEIDFEVLPSTTNTGKAAAAGSAQIFEEAPNNVTFDVTVGDQEATEAAFAKAEHIAEINLINNRLVAASIEPRGAVALHDPKKDHYTLYTGCQTVYRHQTMFAELMGIEQSQLRVVNPDVGGSFGMKSFAYSEQPMVLYAAKKLGRPVKWYSDRSEAFISDVQGRDLVTKAELAMDKDGKFLGLRASTTSTVGAYFSAFAPMIVSYGNSRLLCGVYDLPAMFAEVQVVFTNKVFTDAYRGAGRPEASYAIERLVDVAAKQLGLDPIELRRRNFIQPEQMPYTGPTGFVFDTGNFEANLDGALELVNYDGFAKRQKESEAKGYLRGIGLSTYIESTAGGTPENSLIRVEPDGNIHVVVGAHPAGQGHKTAFGQLAAEGLGVAFDSITVSLGDTDLMPVGGGSGGSRTVFASGGAILDGVAKIEEKGRQIAAHILEAADSDLEFAGGQFTIKGTDRSVSLFDVAEAAKSSDNLPDGMEPGLVADGAYTPPLPTFPNGCHVCEVEIDRDTGQIEILRYAVSDDFGRMLNPMIVEGQVHGGIAQGVGQALLEDCIYDDDTGQLVTGSFMDYAMPRATTLPFIDFTTNNVPCTTNTLGAKGAGEAGTTGACGAVINAVVNALQPYGISHIDMPATPESVWRVINQKAMQAA